MAKRPLNLSLEADVIKLWQIEAVKRDTTVSQLVEQAMEAYLAQVPVEAVKPGRTSDKD